MSAASQNPSENLLAALRGRAMARNTVWNVVGQLSPVMIAAFSIPILIRRMGVDRFGVLTLAWALVGYFSLFDLGLGRALTKVASDRLASGKERELAGAVWTALAMMVAMGALVAVGISLGRDWIASSVMKVPASLYPETIRSIYPLAFSIPLITATSGLRGVLEAQHRFGITNAVRIAMGAFSFLGPLVATQFSTSLFLVILVLVAGRIITAFIHFFLCLHTTPSLRSGIFLDRTTVPELLSTGSWMTVSNLIGPIMVYLDRFLISAFLSVAAVAYYATPFELVTKLWLVPVALTTVLFPAFAAFSVIDQAKLKINYARGVRSCFVLLFPAVFLIFLFAPEGLHLWLGQRFAQQSTVVVRWFALGVLINGLANVPFALLQAADRPDLTGKLHLIEVPFYIAGSVAAIHYYGLPGAAFVWALRLIVEAVILFVLVRRVLFRNALPLRFIAVVLLAVAALFVVSMELRLTTKLISAVIVLGLYVIGSWWAALEDPERNRLRAWFGAMVQARD